MNVLSHIGHKAGLVWHALHDNGPLSDKELAKITGLSKEEVWAALGWLAREGKVEIVGEKRKGRGREFVFELLE